MAETQVFLMLITVTEKVREDSHLAEWIYQINADYMKRFEELGMSIAHYRLSEPFSHGIPITGSRDPLPYNFALVFPGTQDSVRYLANEIESRAKGEVGILAMRTEDLPTRRPR